jgi:2-dehydropantoate 2-reductase
MKAYYHSLCVMANNFTTLLWQKFFKELSTQCQIPAQAALPFLQQTLLNLQHQHTTALTGPLARNDQVTINQNLQALTGDPFHAVYAAFVQAYIQSNAPERIIQ